MRIRNSMMSIVAITSALSLFNCKEKSSDPSPEAAFINGGFTGTVTGTRTDGTTPINETFAYTYDLGANGITPSPNGASTMIVERWESLLGSYASGGMTLPITISTKNELTIPNENYNLFNFSKQESGNTILQVNSGSLVLNDETYLFPIDPTNVFYPFKFTFYSYQGLLHPYLNFSQAGGRVVFQTKHGEEVCFSQPDYNTYQDADGNSYGKFLYIVNALGDTLTVSATYGKLMLRDGTPPSADGNKDVSGFYFTVPGNSGVYLDLSKTVQIKADTYSLSNYTYDTSTGNMAFDFTFNFGGWPRSNSTGNPLTVKGSFKGKVSKVVN